MGACARFAKKGYIGDIHREKNKDTVLNYSNKLFELSARSLYIHQPSFFLLECTTVSSKSGIFSTMKRSSLGSRFAKSGHRLLVTGTPNQGAHTPWIFDLEVTQLTVDTVNGRNPAPVNMENIAFLRGFHNVS